MSILGAIINDLREKRLWPVAVALVAALVAVPVMLTKKPAHVSASPPSTSATPGTPPVSGIPVVNVTANPTELPPNGKVRDPFTQLERAAAAAMTSTGSTVTAGGSSSGSGSTTAGSGGSSSSGSSKSTSSTGSSTSTTGTSTTPTGTTTTPTTTPPPPPGPPVLSDVEAYRVVFAITNASGGFNTIDPLQRLSVLPSVHEPLLVELGVLKGGRRVLFALRPGTVVTGPGTCTPGPIDCEVLSLGVDQIEGLSMRTSAGLSPVALFSVTAIKVQKFKTHKAAMAARNRSSAAGRRLLSSSHHTAVSLFRFEPKLGTVVDLRNLKVRGR